jgi:hypothetical protein
MLRRVFKNEVCSEIQFLLSLDIKIIPKQQLVSFSSKNPSWRVFRWILITI